MDRPSGLIPPPILATVLSVKPIFSAIFLSFLFSSCGLFDKKEEIGPYDDNRSRWQKLTTYEEDRYDSWADKVMHRDEYKRKKAWQKRREARLKD